MKRNPAAKKGTEEILYKHQLLLYCVLERDHQLWHRVQTFLGNHLVVASEPPELVFAERLPVGMTEEDISKPLVTANEGIYFTFKQTEKRIFHDNAAQAKTVIVDHDPVFKVELIPRGQVIPEPKPSDAIVLVYDITDPRLTQDVHDNTLGGLDFGFAFQVPLSNDAIFGYFYPGKKDVERHGYQMAIADIHRHGKLVEVHEELVPRRKKIAEQT